MVRAVQVQGTTPRSHADAAHLTVEQVPINDLHPDPANPRRIGEEEPEVIDRVAAVIVPSTATMRGVLSVPSR